MTTEPSTREMELAHQFIQYFDSLSPAWSYTYNQEENAISYAVEFEAFNIGELFFRIQFREERVCLSAYILPLNRQISTDVLRELTRLVCLINAHFNMPGNFDLDWDNGDIRYRICMDWEGYIPQKGDIQQLADMAFHYYAAFGEELTTVRSAELTCSQAWSMLMEKVAQVKENDSF